LKSFKKKNVLLVDDDEFILKTYGEYLSRYFAVDAESDPVKALERSSREGPYPVLVTDLSMPVMDGMELMTKISEGHPDTIKIVLTGHADLDKAMQAVNVNNAYGFFSKACSPEELTEKVRSALKRYKELYHSRRSISVSKIVTQEEIEFLTK
jgi:DNA-binding NtrC family response regulator